MIHRTAPFLQVTDRTSVRILTVEFGFWQQDPLRQVSSHHYAAVVYYKLSEPGDPVLSSRRRRHAVEEIESRLVHLVLYFHLIPELYRRIRLGVVGGPFR